jgi:hypothetical protein
MRIREPTDQRSTVMNIVIKSIVLAAFGVVFSLSALAADQLTMKPLQAVSFDVESKRAVGYYLNNNGRCDLVLTLAEPAKFDEVNSFTATRFEAGVTDGKTARFDVSPGKSLEFVCKESAEVMYVRGLEQIASSPPK